MCHNTVFRVLRAEIRFQDFGVTSKEEESAWGGIVLVMGLALAMTGLLRLAGVS
jgi:hypothetical protein